MIKMDYSAWKEHHLIQLMDLYEMARCGGGSFTFEEFCCYVFDNTLPNRDGKRHLNSI